MNRTFIAILLVLSLICSPHVVFANAVTSGSNAQTSTETASRTLSLYTLKQNQWQQTSITPLIVNGVSLVPLRVFLQQLEVNVNWFNKTKQMKLSNGETTIELALDQTAVKVNDRLLTIDVAPVIRDGLAMVPFRFVAETLDFNLSFDEQNNAVYVARKWQSKVDALRKKYSQSIRDNGILMSLTSNAQMFAVGLSKTVKPNVFVLDKPDRIVMDLPYTMVHPSESLQYKNNHPLISKVRYAQHSTRPAMTRIVVELKEKANYRIVSDLRSSHFLVMIEKEILKSTTEAPKNPTPVVQPVAPKPSNPVPANNGSIDSISRSEVLTVSSKSNVITIQLNRVVSWSYFSLDKPDRLVLDLKDTYLAAKVEKTVKGTVDEVSQIRTAQNSFSPALVKVVVDFKQKATFKITELKDKKQILIEILRPQDQTIVKPTQPTQPIQPVSGNGTPKTKFTIVIDAGHGDFDSGAVSMFNSKNLEKTFNLNVALKVNRLLANDPQFHVILTRSTDRYLQLMERVDIANQANADAFISIHANSFKQIPSIRGTETFYSREDSIDLARIVHRNMLEATGFPDRKVKQADYRVIKSTTMPAVLIEAGFISNSVEEKIIFDNAFQEKVAQSIVKSLREYFSQKEA
jgi:N-acetylmuramoyl-L-alanine amidase